MSGTARTASAAGERARPRSLRRASLASLLALATIFAVASTASPSPSPAGAEPPARLDTSLAARLADADGPLPVLVTLRDRLPDEQHTSSPGELIRNLRHASARSQSSFLGRVSSPARRLWLVNAVALRARPPEIRRLARDPAVERIEYDGPVRLSADETPLG